MKSIRYYFLVSSIVLHCNLVKASIIGKISKVVTCVTAPFILKHTLLSEKPAGTIKDLWQRCKEDIPRASNNIKIYAELAQKRVSELQKYLENNQQTPNPKKVFDKTKKLVESETQEPTAKVSQS